MAGNRVALGVLFVLLATASVKAVINGCVVYGTNTTTTINGTNGTNVTINGTNVTINGTNVTFLQETCLQCEIGFTLSTGNFSCTTCPVRCATCNATGTCLSCISGYTLQNGVCPDCGAGCARCGNNGCEQCNQGFYLRNGVCLACSKYCATCSNEFICDTCVDDYERYGREDRSDYFFCKLKEDRRSAYWTFLVVAGILALLIFAVCCYLSERKAMGTSYAPLSVSAPAYQLTTVQQVPVVPAYGVAAPGPVVGGPVVGGPVGVAGKTGYYGGY